MVREGETETGERKTDRQRDRQKETDRQTEKSKSRHIILLILAYKSYQTITNGTYI